MFLHQAESNKLANVKNKNKYKQAWVAGCKLLKIEAWLKTFVQYYISNNKFTGETSLPNQIFKSEGGR